MKSHSSVFRVIQIVFLAGALFALPGCGTSSGSEGCGPVDLGPDELAGTGEPCQRTDQCDQSTGRRICEFQEDMGCVCTVGWPGHCRCGSTKI